MKQKNSKPRPAPRLAPDRSHLARLIAPPGVTSVSVGGREHAVVGGFVEVPAHLAASLLAHGFTRAE